MDRPRSDCEDTAGAEASARATLGGAVAAANQLDGQAGAVVIGAGRAAFSDALRLCAAISVVGSLALAGFVALTLRRMTGRGKPRPERSSGIHARHSRARCP